MQEDQNKMEKYEAFHDWFYNRVKSTQFINRYQLERILDKL